MSFLGSMDDNKKYAKMADLQIDGNEPSNTSPVQSGSSEAGGAPMSGKNEFTKERTRPAMVGNQGVSMKRRSN